MRFRALFGLIEAHGDPVSGRVLTAALLPSSRSSRWPRRDRGARRYAGLLWCRTRETEIPTLPSSPWSDSTVTDESGWIDFIFILEGIEQGFYQELRPARAGTPRRGVDAMPFKISQTVEGATAMPSPASSPAIRRYPRCSLSAAMRSTRRTTRRWVGGRPGLFGFDLAAQRRRTISRCQRRIVPG